MPLKVTEVDDNWMPITPGKPISGGSEDNGKATTLGEKETAQYTSRKRHNGTLDINKKKRHRMRKHRPKIYDDSKPNNVLIPPKTPKTPKTPKQPKTVSPNCVQKKSQNSPSYGFESCKRSLIFDVGKSDNSGKVATFKRNLPRSCRFPKSLEETGRQDIHVYKRHSNINSKEIFLFTPAFEVYKRTIKDNYKAATLGEQEAVQYDTTGGQDGAVEVPNSDCEGKKAHCGHESGVDIKESRKRRNEGLDLNKKKSPRMKKHNPKIYDDSQLNKVSEFETSNSLIPTLKTPKTTTPKTPNRVQKKFQTSNHNNSTSYGFESCKRSLNFDARKSDDSGMIDTFKRNLPRSCMFRRKSLEASQNLLVDNSETSNGKQAEENGQKYVHVYQRRFNARSNGICLVTPAFELYQRRFEVNGRKHIHVYQRMSKKKRALRKKPNTNRWYFKEDEEGKKSLVRGSSKKSTQCSKKKVENAITVAQKPVPRITANVDLDDKSLRVWKMLMENGGSEPADNDKDEWWQEQGEIFGRRMDSFLEKMRVVQGNMRFSPWKGSVTDSVVGAYLTQNVTDHLSSSAFMSVAARFPAKIRNEEVCFHDEFASSEESVASTSCADASRTTHRVQRKFYGSPLYDSDGERITKKEKKEKPQIDWDELRKSFCGIEEKELNENHKDSVDWDAVSCCSVKKLAKIIIGRGMHKKLAKRIKVDFLERIYKEHGSLDLEWLRNVPPHKVKEFLLSFFGLGLKSVECIRLLTLRHLAFPVDTNVARVATRLGWVPLQSLPDNVQIHNLNAYPPLNNIQKYLFPRLCTLDKEKLYELHCHLITFGKVFCSKKNPNCTACPMKAECLHYASAFPRLAISGSKDNSSETSIIPVTDELRHSMYVTLLRSSYEPEGNNSGSQSYEPIIEVPLSPEPKVEDIEDLCNTKRRFTDFTPPSPSFYQEVNVMGSSTYSQTCEPIVEVPPSPEPEAKKSLPFMTGMEDLVYESDDENGDDDGGADDGGGDDNTGGDDDSGDDDDDDHEDDMRQALALASEEALDLCKPKKFSAKWRTMHLVYELPKDHPCLAGFEAREPEDPTPYLLSLWFPGEDRNSPEYVQNREYILNRNNGEERVHATVLIPCRNATRGSFPLNGTYFQVNEVFADHETSYVPLQVPRNQLVNLKIRILGCGTSTTSIHRGLSTGAIQSLFCTGSICVRGFNRKTRRPRPLHVNFHTTRRGVAAAAAAAAEE